MSKAPSNHYISNDSFKAALIEYNETNIMDNGEWLTKKNKINNETKLNKIKAYIEKNNRIANMTKEEIDQLSERFRQANERVGKYLVKIIENLLKKKNFVGYTNDIKNEMRSNAQEQMLKAIKKIDTDRSNPFAYFTTVCFNAFLEVLNAIKEHNKTNLRLNLIYNV